MIRKEGSRFVVLSEAGKQMGEYPSRRQAEERIRAIEYFKAHSPKGNASTGSAFSTWVKRSSAQELPVPPVVQKQDYSCGPASLLACVRYFLPTAQANEEMLAYLAGTSEKDGTEPEGLVAAAAAFGLQAEVREHMTMQDLRTNVDQGALTIVALQAWADTKGPPPEGYSVRWQDGHYVVCTGYDGPRFYFMDPSLEGARATLTPQELAARWHDVDGNHMRYSLGVVVRGPRAAEKVPVGQEVKMG